MVLFQKKQHDQKNANSLKKYLKKSDLGFMKKEEYQNLQMEMEQLRNANLEKRIQKISSEMGQKKASINGEINQFRQEFENKLAVVKLDFAKFRDQISEIQNKTVNEAEKVLNEFSKKKLSTKNKKKIRKEELEKHLKEVLEDREKSQTSEEEIRKLKTKLSQINEMIKNGRVTGLEEARDFRKEIEEELTKLRKGNHIKGMVESQVKKLFENKKETGWGSSGQGNVLRWD
jgi:chromosome segregation ATPase